LPVDRATISRRALNLVFLFKALTDMSFRPQTKLKSIMAGDTVTPILTTASPRNDITTVYLDRAEKFCVPAARDVYVAVRNIPGSISVDVDDETGRRTRNQTRIAKVTTKPVLSRVLPLTFKQLVKALRDILAFLIEFHGRGFNHRDIRWPNILRTGQGKWVLIDFELAAAEGSEAPTDRELDSEKKPHESRPVGARYTSAGDIWQVGQLVGAWQSGRGTSLSSYPQFLQLVTEMTNTSPIKRPSAAAASERLLLFLEA
jgi:serine/threonine protein kinase